MSEPIPCASSAKPTAKVYELHEEIKFTKNLFPVQLPAAVERMERLCKEALSEWADLATAFSIQKDCLDQVDALHKELLAGCKKIDCLLAEVASWDCVCADALASVRDQLVEHIVLSDPDYIRWNIAAPIPDA